MNKTKYYSCVCGSEVITLSKYDGESELFLNTYHLLSRNTSFIERIKHSINILIGRKSLISSVVISKATAKNMGSELILMSKSDSSDMSSGKLILTD